MEQAISFDPKRLTARLVTTGMAKTLTLLMVIVGWKVLLSM